jgi:hypothetical protein
MPKSAAKFSSLRHSPWCRHGPKWLADLKPKTSRTLEEWIALTKKDGPKELVPRAGPCKTIVPLYREDVFAQIKPTTLSCVDFGLYFTMLVFSLFRPARRLFRGLQWRNRGLIAASTSLFACRSPRIQGFFPLPQSSNKKRRNLLRLVQPFFNGLQSQSSSPIKNAAVRTVVHNPRLSPTLDCVIFMVRTILLEIR